MVLAQSSGPTSETLTGKDGSPAPAFTVYSDESGFSFSYPSDWEVVDSKPLLPVAQMQARERATSAAERQGASCTQLALILSKPSAQARIVVLTIAYDCVGGIIKQSDLAAVGTGISAGMKKSMLITEPTYAAYRLGTHEMWVERANGSPLTHPESKSSVETVCTMLKKSLVCWMDVSGTAEGIAALDNATVTLEGERASALVPPSAFHKR